MSKYPVKKVLILITIQFAVRYILRTGLLQAISRFAKPVVWISWRDEKLIQELEAAGAEVHAMPVPRYGRYYNFVRGIVKEKFKRLINSPSTKIDEKRGLLIYGKPKVAIGNRFFLLISKTCSYLLPKPVLLKLHDWFIKRNTSLHEVVPLIKAQHIDVLFSVTPFLREEQVILAACKNLKLKTITSILSFDNITTRGFLPIIFDHYAVWNKYNYDELYRIYPEVRKSTVEIVGPAQFDFYWDTSYLWSKERWLQELGLPDNRPVVLFGAGFYAIVPQEHLWLKQLDEAIENGEIEQRPLILFRPHPVDPIDRWLPILKEAKHIIRDDPWKTDGVALSKSNITRYDIEKLCSTLYWSDIHINASSTMTVDGAIYDKPQIGPAYDEAGKFTVITQELYSREHYLPITLSGGLTLANSRTELIQAINASLIDNTIGQQGRKKMIDEICYYSDGKSTQRLATLLEKYICG